MAAPVPPGWLWAAFLPAIAYQGISLFASLRQSKREPATSGFWPPISILKPVRGLDPDMYSALVSQAQQDYPEFEILFGVADANDAAVPLIRQLQNEFSHVRISLHIGTATAAANAKVGVLIHLARHARYPIWLVNDSDIRVTPRYLEEVVAPLENPSIGVVTCLYRPVAHSRASAWEAFGIAIDFMPSTLVAPLVGVREFGLGSTLCFRAADFKAAGGFEAIADYIADDYQLAKRIVDVGKRAHLASYVVETSLGDAGSAEVWRHQLRWARTIRTSKGAGFAGLPVTHAGLWILMAAVVQLWPAATLLFTLRIAAALASGWLVLHVRRTPFWALLAPFWDLYAFAVWLASYASREVRWRDRRLRIRRDGRLEQL
jgi:ceramide glucosyltransferase